VTGLHGRRCESQFYGRGFLGVKLSDFVKLRRSSAYFIFSAACIDLARARQNKFHLYWASCDRQRVGSDVTANRYGRVLEGNRTPDRAEKIILVEPDAERNSSAKIQRTSFAPFPPCRRRIELKGCLRLNFSRSCPADQTRPRQFLRFPHGRFAFAEPRRKPVTVAKKNTLAGSPTNCSSAFSPQRTSRSLARLLGEKITGGRHSSGLYRLQFADATAADGS